MARFDPSTHPDRLAFEANARRIRSEEIGRTFAAAAAWLHHRQQEFASRAARITAAAAAHSHRHSVR